MAEALKDLRKLWGKKTMEADTLRELVEHGRAKNELRARHHCRDSQ
ncbi:hypothetical protein [Bradyrhizobium retamae]|nr:hypothetical protein [Bradyrhizobium retamae]